MLIKINVIRMICFRHVSYGVAAVFLFLSCQLPWITDTTKLARQFVDRDNVCV